ncbi:MAG: tetratricopeptide repeat protein [Xenococcaceae cyanobacterium]
MSRRLQFFQHALYLFQREQNPPLWAALQGELGNSLCQNPLGNRAENIELAIAAYQQALEVTTRTAMPVDWAQTMMNLANAYSSRIRGERAENIELAIAAYTAALEVRTRQAFPADWARTQYNLGNALRDRFQLLHKVEDIKQAIAAYENAIEVIKETEDNEFLANCLYRLGKALFEGGAYTEAIEKLQLCQQIYQQQKNIASLASTLFELARLYHLTGRLEQARLYFKDALRLFRRLQDEEKIAAATTALGNLEIQIGKIPQALTHLRTAQEYYQEKDNLERLEEINHLLQILQHA